jgi:hypothetical protein
LTRQRPTNAALVLKVYSRYYPGGAKRDCLGRIATAQDANQAIGFLGGYIDWASTHKSLLWAKIANPLPNLPVCA